MKNYEKPKLMVLSVSANDALCACGTKTRFEHVFDIFDKDGNGHFGPEDDLSPLLTEDVSCESTKGFESYCKFTAANTIFTS